MIEITKQIKDIARKLFEEKQVDIFLAWEKSEFDFQSRPFFARSIEDVDNIIFDEFSIHNLSNALLRFRDGKEKIGIVVKGCDSRGIVRLLEDHQFTRERLYIVGVSCPGMKDPLKAFRNESGFEKNINPDLTAAKCLDCIQPNPVIYDVLLGEEQTAPMQGDRFKKVKEIEAMTPDERYKFFEDTLSTCIRCYACRQVCVACNCRTCIFDEARPQWVGRESTVSDNMMYHIIRASHMTGRCIECGECERVCPVNIPLMLLNQKLIKDVDSFYGPFDAGLNYEEGAKPPLSKYRENDPDDFL